MGNKPPLGVCIVGCGMMGNIHAACWKESRLAQVVAVVDVIEDRARILAEAHGLDDWYRDYRQAVKLPIVDVVSVCTPTYLHAQVAETAALAGKHILSEKPMALTHEQAIRMAETAQQQGVRLSLGFMRRHSPVTEVMRNFIQSGNLGRPVLAYALDIRELRPKLAMHDRSQNGGPVIDMFVHYLSQWAYIFDSEPNEVIARGLISAKDRLEVGEIQELAIDTASITVRYSSGDIGSFIVSWGLPPGANPVPHPDQLLGPKGVLEAEFSRYHQTLRHLGEGGVWTTVAESNEDMYLNEITSFARSIVMDQPLRVNPQEGINSLDTALAAIQSCSLA
jgi:predicted dehydrogenase